MNGITLQLIPGIPDFILAVILFDVAVGLVVLGYVFKRWKKKKSMPVKSVTITESQEIQGKLVYRCPNKTCNKLIREPAIEKIYLTEPPTEQLICPYCETPLEQIKTGRLKIGLAEEIVEEKEERKPRLKTYDLTVESDQLFETMKLLKKQGFDPIPSPKENEMHLIITSEQNLSFNKMKKSGMITNWREVS